MKVNSLLMKTALAAAVASVSFGAFAGTLSTAQPAVLANEIFGAGSETTSIRMPAVKFTSTGAAVARTAGDTVKLTLGGNAVFSENYQDPTNWGAQGVSVLMDGAPATTTAHITSVTGGTAGDNQITITFGANPGTNLDNITLEGFKVQNLTDQLARSGAGGLREAKVTMEVRSAGGTYFENTNALAAFVSINGVEFSSAPTNYDVTANRKYIQVGDSMKQFGNTVRGDYTTKSRFIDFGTVTIKRGQTPASYAFAGVEAGKEIGGAFDFTGQDEVFLGLTTDADLSTYGTVYLSTTACADPVPTTGVYRLDNVTNNTVKIPTANIDLAAGTTLNLCANVPGTGRISPAGSFALAGNAEYFNVRYTDSSANLGYGPVLANGCQITLFNVPNVAAADKAFVRFTNTSTIPGELNGYVWNEDGTRLDVDASLLANIDAHETVVLHTNAGQASGVYLGDVLPEFAADNNGQGRGRLVIEGAFPSCEALGLVRSSNGTLVNLTSTTHSGGPSNTSNTTN